MSHDSTYNLTGKVTKVRIEAKASFLNDYEMKENMNHRGSHFKTDQVGKIVNFAFVFDIYGVKDRHTTQIFYISLTDKLV